MSGNSFDSYQDGRFSCMSLEFVMGLNFFEAQL